MAGAYCSMLLGDLGAEVIKIEKPDGGDDTRRMAAHTPHGESPAFMAVNRNKRSVVIDLRLSDGAEVLTRLASTADILVENFRPGTMQRFGLGYEVLRTVNRALVYCSISGYGATGPYAHKGGFDLVAQGMSGIMSITGEPGRPPVKAGVPICDLNAGMFAAQGAMAAYIHRLSTGQGQHVETSLLEAGIAYTVWETALYFAYGDIAEPTGSAHRLAAPYQAFPTLDGYITVGAANQRNWERLCAAIDMEQLTSDERFADPGQRLAYRAELVSLLTEVFLSETTDVWVERLNAEEVPCGPIYNIAEVYEDPHVQARGVLVELDHPLAGPIKNISVPIKLSVTPTNVRRPAPLLGQHTHEVLMEGGYSAQQIEKLLSAGVVGGSSAA
jgi:crotonobetainyl-CoA:carnitine CoA-transferase CaiB-like acyl-CoA transferase